MVIAFAFFCGQLVVGWSNDLIDYQEHTDNVERGDVQILNLV